MLALPVLSLSALAGARALLASLVTKSTSVLATALPLLSLRVAVSVPACVGVISTVVAPLAPVSASVSVAAVLDGEVDALEQDGSDGSRFGSTTVQPPLAPPPPQALSTALSRASPSRLADRRDNRVLNMVTPG